MSNATIFNSLVRQLLIHIGEEAPELITNSLNTKKKIKILRTLSFGDKTTRQIWEATGINETTLLHVLQQLVGVGVVEVKAEVANRREDKKGRLANLWGLV